MVAQDEATMEDNGQGNKSIVFFRVDDVGDWSVDGERLRPLLDVFIKLDLPFNLQVIPKQLSSQTGEYIRQVREAYPALLEIDQHGYSHDVKEFAAETRLEQQIQYIRAGRGILEEAFGMFSPVFTPPEHAFSEATFQALDLLGYMVFSKETRTSLTSKVFYSTGQLMRKRFLFQKKIGYHTRLIPGTHMVELSIQVDTANGKGDIKTLSEFLGECIQSGRASPVTGVLIHPIDLSSSVDMGNMVSILTHIKDDRSFECKRLFDLAREMGRQLSGWRGQSNSDMMGGQGKKIRV